MNSVDNNTIALILELLSFQFFFKDKLGLLDELENPITEEKLKSWLTSQKSSSPSLVLRVLLDLDEQVRLLNTCPVTFLVPRGNAVLELCYQLRISIFSLAEYDSESLQKLVENIVQLPSDASSEIGSTIRSFFQQIKAYS